MSIVGPRPHAVEHNNYYKELVEQYAFRHKVKPGITGWAQVCYPYGASVEDAYQKVAYDLFYIRNFSLLMDFAIALKSLRVVILGKGI